MTIALAFITPLVALAAFALTYRSYQVANESLETSKRAVAISESNLKVGQRAYVFIQNGEHVERLQTLIPADTIPGAYSEFEYGFDIVNSGNTPADITDFEIEHDFAQGRLSIYGPVELRHRHYKKLGSIGPGGKMRAKFVYEVLHRMNQTYPRTPEILSMLKAKHSNLGTLFLTGKLIYLDVFGDSHTVNWCWRAFHGARYPENCDGPTEGF